MLAAKELKVHQVTGKTFKLPSEEKDFTKSFKVHVGLSTSVTIQSCFD